MKMGKWYRDPIVQKEKESASKTGRARDTFRHLFEAHI
jgi:hypothetical protein